MSTPLLIQKGRRLLIAVIVACLGVTAALDVHFVIHFGLSRLMRHIPITCLNGILCYFLYGGHAWARWILGFLIVINGAGVIGLTIYYSFTCSTTLPLISFLVCGGAFVYFYLGMALFLSRSITAFMKQQRTNRSASV